MNELPQGLDTRLHERGGGLSEGQAQRIAIARGLLRPGSILLLDEVSSALDEPTERELFSRLLAARPQDTILLITHRPSVISATISGDCNFYYFQKMLPSGEVASIIGIASPPF